VNMTSNVTLRWTLSTYLRKVNDWKGTPFDTWVLDGYPCDYG
jgi:hypothetical protein